MCRFCSVRTLTDMSADVTLCIGQKFNHMSTYVKLFSDILDSTVWDAPSHVRVVWITLLAMADRDGIVSASVPGLAKRARVERTQCEQALALFMAPDPDSRTTDFEGRRLQVVPGGWLLLTYEKHRDRATLAEKRQKDADRKARARARDLKSDPSCPRTDGTERTCPRTSTNVTLSPEMRSDESDLSGTDLDPDLTHAGASTGDALEPEPAQPQCPQDALGSPTVEERAQLWVRDPNIAVASYGPPEVWPEVIAAFEAFSEAWPGSGRLRTRDTRAPVIVARYAEGFTLDDLRRSALGAKQDDHFTGNPSFQTVQTIWRDAGQIDKFTKLLGSPPTRKRGQTPVQPSYGIKADMEVTES